MDEHRQHRNPSSHAEPTTSPIEAETSSPNLTMRGLPADVDEVITEFLNDMITRFEVPPAGTEEQGDGDDSSDSESNSESSSVDIEEEDSDLENMEVESLLDVESEDDYDYDYQAHLEFDQSHDSAVHNNIATSPTSDVDMMDASPTEDEDLPMDGSNMPGARIKRCLNQLEHLHQQKIHAELLPSWPFADYLEFQFVQWMVENDVSQGARDKLIKLPIISQRCGLSFSSNYALNKLLDKLPTAGPKWRRITRKITGNVVGANGKKLTELVEIWIRDILKVVEELLGNIAYGKQLVFVPRKVYLDGSERKIDEMWTADWWNEIQKKLPPGATVIPIIISSDATQLTNFSGGKSAWPVYITIGNIPKGIRAKVNSYATMLLAYLPSPKFDCFTKKERGNQKCKLFHECMKIVLEPLVKAGNEGVEMECGDGFVRRCFPILAAYIADNPEQTMIAGCRRNRCYRCTVGRDKRGDFPPNPPPPRDPLSTADALEAESLDHTTSLFVTEGLKPYGKPFWADLPHTNIFTCLTPDILHQLHKGVFREHLMNWCIKLVTQSYGNASQIDNRFKLIPRHSELRHFLSGVTALKQSTANEHRQMQKVFIGIMHGLVPDRVLKTVLAVIDFIYYARLPVHTDTTLRLLDEALARFHEFKDTFIELEIRKDFNVNKIHSMVHYSESIRQMGAADGYNTETPERLHIEFAKRAYKATNRRDFFAQMTVYLERRERVAKFDLYLRWAIPEYAESLRTQRDVYEDPMAPGWRLARTSPIPPISITILPRVYGIQDFKYYIDEFFEDYNIPLVFSPDDKLTVFPKATQIIDDAFVTGLVDRVHASPVPSGSGSHGSFDTVLIRKAEQGRHHLLNRLTYGMSDHRVGRVRLIFKLPPHYNFHDPLVYIQQFDGPSRRDPLVEVNMYGIKRKRHTQQYGKRYVEEVIPLAWIRRTCHLIPQFGRAEDTPLVDMSPPDPLELFDNFFINSYFDLHTFQLLSA
ncbi:hypothetical protein RSOL_193550 [Rhizoctonia solani AG-3 Rhs1AP]|uniref:Zn-finger protein n=2 Tax=Rhizoctonia solani AG-3 TaxID=1086053 RepID=A0A074RMQ1_9AGAM|nr:hypothetical protein RSOL_193550 [Rhizoctonia solani AG-3 Rhs1AP]KEP48341.1 hypothetical protein V565_127170 [Rhizoctonia solani 123E]